MTSPARPGDSTAARTAYQASLDIRTRLAAADPTNTNGSGTCRSATTSSVTWPGRPATSTAARTAYQASLDIRTRLAAADPTNSEWQRDLSISHERLGDLARAAGDFDRRPHRLPGQPRHRPRLAAADPTNTDGSGTCRSATTAR